MVDDDNDITLYQKELEVGYNRLSKRLKIYDNTIEDVQCLNQLRKLDNEVTLQLLIHRMIHFLLDSTR